MIRVTPAIAIDEAELGWSFARSSGPGGQNVNKVETAVELRFDVRHSPSIPDWVRPRLEALAGRRLTLEGVIVIFAQEYRSQERNRAAALDRLVDLIRTAAAPVIKRRPTRPTRGSVERRLDSKSRRSTTKRLRGRDDMD